MTVSSTVSRSGPYTGNGVTTVFNYAFRILNSTDLNVVKTVDNVDTTIDPNDYTVSGVGTDNGTIVFTLPPAAGVTITIIRNAPFTQEQDYENQGPFFAETVEDALDLAVMRDQQLAEQLDRALQIPVGADPSELPLLISNVIRLTQSADNIDTVANIAGDVVAVSDVSGDVTTVAGVVSYLPTVAAVAGDIPAVSAVASDIPTVAANVADITNFADVYQGPKTTDPALRNNGSPLQHGDLYFNTMLGFMQVYDGTEWGDTAGTPLNVAFKAFIGNGAATAFALNVPPGSVNNILVEVGGILKKPVTDFTVSGVTLTFTSAPANLAEINTWVIATTVTLNVPADASVTRAKLDATLSSTIERSVLEYGAVGDGVTDNSAAVQAAITAAGWRGTVVLPLGVYHCATPPSNPKGVKFRGAGYLTSLDANGDFYRLDLRADEYELITGMEYLSAWHNVLRTGSGIQNCIIDYLGDSTTAGTGITAPRFLVDQLVSDNFTDQVGTSPIMNNRGVGGATTEDIRTVQAPLSIAAGVHCIVLRPGHNDIYSRLGAPAPRGEADTNAAAELVRASLDSMLASIRASYSHMRTAIILMTPNSGSFSRDGRAERYYETLSPMYRAMARKYKCVFVDTYRMWRDARDMNDPTAIGVWLDRAFPGTYNSGGLHPMEAFNLQIADTLTSLLLPRTLARIISASVAPALQNGWINHSGSSIFARRQGKLVQVEGILDAGTVTSGTVLFTLPVGMRPARRRFFAALTGIAGQTASIYVDTTGSVVLQTFPASGTYVSLESINFMLG